ncbi:3-hydroxyacyl-CoA dehydrogenase family protein [Arenibacter latericius]|uniref:3-hydroxyacyl-CoA dehydrogenase family protein n=1 Tax=Arenibacter latericius TaxID=86104 RepID=UPI0004087A13|nr:3-hydroxyacyl-CoA dehydrogenase NAD-binding domain-containing protein [Arenibacter latericius]
MEKLAIIGCGTMGHTIALSAVISGIQVKMYGVNDEDIEGGKAGILKNLKTLSNHGFIDRDKILLLSSKIITTSSINEVIKDATYVIEAIPENLNLKMNLFKDLDNLCDEDVILASNTSGLSPNSIASLTKYSHRVIVTHFWNPAHLVTLAPHKFGVIF